MAELTTLARPYAKAAFEVALYADSLNTWSTMLAKLAAVAAHENVVVVLLSPSLTAQQQADIIIELCGDEINEQLKNFISILAENKRIGILAEIGEIFEDLKANQEKTLEVDVLTAFPLEDSVEQTISKSLKERLKRNISIKSEVDKSLIGGMIIHAGDLVIDGSVRNKLSKLAEVMNS